MFLQFYRLRDQPFGVTPNPRYLYHGPAHREALASLIYGIEADLGFAALIAEPGMGKTTLLYYLLERFRSSARTAFIFQTQCDRLELLRYLANELELSAEETDAVVLNDRIREVLVEEARAGRRVIVIIDEAQNLSEDALEAVRLLSDFETPDCKLMHIILAGQPELAEKLARPGMAQLLQRIAMLNRLSPFGDAEQVSHYLSYRLQVAGYTGPALFTPGAIEIISANSKGIPRQINRICFNALSLGCAMDKRRVDEQIIREVLRDLDLGVSFGSGMTMDAKLHSPGEQGNLGGRDPVLKSTDGKVSVRGSLSVVAESAVARPTPAVVPIQSATAAVEASRPPQVAVNAGPAISVRATQSAAARPLRRGATLPEFHQEPRTSKPIQRARPQAPVASVRPHFAKATQVPTTKKPTGEANRGAFPESGGRTQGLILLSIIAIPLLVLMAWLYLGQRHVLPAGADSGGQSVEQTLPPASDNTNHGTSVDLPPAPDAARSR